MITWAVANQKGGVGKTTTVVNLGGLLAMQGLRTLLVDLDPHGSLSVYFKLDPDSVTNSVYQLFDHGGRPDASTIEKLIYATPYENLSLLPASTAMVTLDKQLGAQNGMGLVLNRALHAIADCYDYVLLDCPPQLGVLMVNALASCQHLIIPMQTEFLALKGLERMLNTLNMITRAQKYQLDYSIVPTMYDQRTSASVNTLQSLKQKYSAHLWPQVIPVDTQFRDASKSGIPLTMRSPQDRGALAYAGLLRYLKERPLSGVGSTAVA